MFLDPVELAKERTQLEDPFDKGVRIIDFCGACLGHVWLLVLLGQPGANFNRIEKTIKSTQVSPPSSAKIMDGLRLSFIKLRNLY